MAKKLSYKELLSNLKGLTVRNVVPAELGWVVEAEGSSRALCPDCGVTPIPVIVATALDTLPERNRMEPRPGMAEWFRDYLQQRWAAGCRHGRFTLAPAACQEDIHSIRGMRDRALLAVLVTCALRRGELSRMNCEHLARRDGRWVFLDFTGKGNKVRSVAVPLWVKQEIDGWLDAAGIEKGPIFRRVSASGRVGKDALTERAVWQLVRECATQIGIGELAPHDLRRTAAKLCRSKGGELEQIQFLLGHESILTTERYLGSEQDLKNAVNDVLVFE